MISQKKKKDPNLKDIPEFVEARSRTTNHPIFKKFKTNKLEQPYLQCSSNKEERKELKCPSCKRNHCLLQCDGFKKLSLSNCYQFIHANKLRDNCLVPGHFIQDCPKRSFCCIQGCKKKHLTYLHVKETPPSQNEIKGGQTEPPTTPNAAHASNSYFNVNASQVSSSSTVRLTIVPVKVKVKGSNKKVLTCAFLDSDSNILFCTKLGTKGKETWKYLA